ncbi:MAG: hypothetical protein IT379_16865 [Deltaproteobacteria bacterium]|nr:hypothetical protein [Deltaproteobacteria bacterium]
MTILTNPDDTYEHVCASDRELPIDDLHRTVYLLAALSGRQETAIMNAVGAAKDHTMGTVMSEIARLACRGWSNLHDAAGLVEFRPASKAQQRVLGIAVPECCDPELWERLPFAQRRELAEQVLLRIQSGLSETDRKNS